MAGWIADYPEESAFIPLQFACGAVGNFTGFCDPELDRRMVDVQELQLSDPSAATAAWADIEREIIDQAPVVPLVNVPIVQVVSERVGNYQAHPQWSVLVDQLLGPLTSIRPGRGMFHSRAGWVLHERQQLERQHH